MISTNNSSDSWKELSLADKFRLRWKLTARPNQLTPEGKWSVWLLMAGRGYGKTRTGAEDSSHFALRNPGSRIALVAPTYPDARDTMIEGESGLLACIPPSYVADWNRSIGEMVLTNQSQFKIFTGEKPDRLRGPQHHRAWCDEVGSWRYSQDTWDMLTFGLRLGSDPRMVVTTTPRPLKLLRSLLADEGTILSTGSTYDNKDNLPETFLRKIAEKYEGTRLGRQEIYAELLDDVPGALWQRSMLDRLRIRGVDPMVMAKQCRRIVIAVDPAVTSGEDSDETGIAAVGLREDGHGVVLEDASARETPRGWASIAIQLFRKYSADRIIGETNNGGDMVEEVLRMVDPNIPFHKVTASRGKYVRAEPIASLYEQGRVHHIGSFDALEDQMCMFTPDNIAKNSPDRTEAVVWGFTDLYDGMMNLGLLAYADAQKVVRAGALVKPVTTPVQVHCPACDSVAVTTAGAAKRCNQCGHVFGEKEEVRAVINRTNIAKFRR